jgi:hypothetical protein
MSAAASNLPSLASTTAPSTSSSAMPTPQPVSPPDTTPIVVDDEEDGSAGEVVGEELKNDMGDSQVSSIVHLQPCRPARGVELWRAFEA